MDDLPVDVPRKTLGELYDPPTDEGHYNIAMLACCEMLKSGTTCVLENSGTGKSGRQLDRKAEAIEESGMRAIIAPAFGDIDSRVPENQRLSIYDAIKGCKRIIREWNDRADERIKVWLGPIQIGISVSTELTREMRNLADRYGIGITVHLSERLSRLEELHENYGFNRHVEYAYDVGLLGPDVLAAHCVWVTKKEIQILRSTGTKVVHNPGGNMYLGSGIAPIPRLLESDIPVALGTDEGTTSLDLFEQMKYAVLIHKAVALDPTVIKAQKVLEMATIMGATALGLERDVGSLEIGKKADIILVDLQKPHLTPLHKITSNIVYAANGGDVDTTIIDGKIVMENREFKTVDEEKILRNAIETASCLRNSRLGQYINEKWDVI
jgi:5-methylthioadenosine/S-adenosylhomocysteine deaminase